MTRSTQGVEVSYDRPYATPDRRGAVLHPRGRDGPLPRALRLPVGYTTIELDRRRPAQAPGARADRHGHSEYWSQRASARSRRRANAGTSLIFISSDTMAWRVRFERGDARLERGGPSRPQDRRLQGVRERSTPTGRSRAASSRAAARAGWAAPTTAASRRASRSRAAGVPLLPVDASAGSGSRAGCSRTAASRRRRRASRGSSATSSMSAPPARRRAHASWASARRAVHGRGRALLARVARRAEHAVSAHPRGRSCSRRARSAGCTGSRRCRRPQPTRRARPDPRRRGR